MFPPTPLGERRSRVSWARGVAAAVSGPSKHVRILAFLGLVGLFVAGGGPSVATPQDDVVAKAARHREQGLLYAKEGSPQAALGHFHSALELDPSDKVSHDNSGVILAESGRTSEALSHFEKAIEIDPEFVDAHLHRAMALSRSGDSASALSSLYLILRLKPDLLQARYMLSGALRAKGDTRGAERLLRRIVEQAPRFAEARYNLAALLQRDAKTEEAAKHLEQAAAVQPDDPNILLALGIARAELNDVSAAVESLGKVIDMQPRNPVAHYNLGLALTKRQNLDQAIKHFRTACDLDPKHPTARRALGVGLLQAGELESAAKELTRAAADFPDDSEVHNSLGTVLLRQRNLGRSIHHFEEAIRVNPLLVKAHRNLAQAYQRAGRPEDARKTTEQSEEVARKRSNHGRAMLLMQSGKHLLDTGDTAKALEQLREAKDLSPEFEDAQLWFGVAVREAGADPEESRRALEEVLKLNPNRAEGHFQLGLTLQKIGDTAGALKELRTSVELAPSLIEAQRALGNLALESGKYSDARAAFEAVLAWEPDDEQARKGREKVMRESSQ